MSIFCFLVSGFAFIAVAVKIKNSIVQKCAKLKHGFISWWKNSLFCQSLAQLFIWALQPCKCLVKSDLCWSAKCHIHHWRTSNQTVNIMRRSKRRRVRPSKRRSGKAVPPNKRKVGKKSSSKRKTMIKRAGLKVHRL